MTGRNRNVLQLAAIALSAGIALWFDSSLEGSEFSGGSFTGPLLYIHGLGAILLLLALCLMFKFRRAAAAIVFLALLLCLPIYILFVAPGPVRYLVGGEWKTVLRVNFVWDPSAIAGTVTLILSAILAARAKAPSKPS
jgi:hypothetical protein